MVCKTKKKKNSEDAKMKKTKRSQSEIILNGVIRIFCQNPPGSNKRLLPSTFQWFACCKHG